VKGTEARDDFDLSNIQQKLEEVMKVLLPKFLFILMVMFLISCEESTDPGDDPGSGVEPDSGAAVAKVEEANEALEDELFLFISQVDDDLIDGPSDIDFTLSNSLYKEAIELDPENLDANFGAGLTEVLIITQDAELQNVFDEWEAFIDTGTVFEPEPGSVALFSMSNLFPIFTASSSIPGVSEREITRSYFNLMKMGVADPPTIEFIQIVIEENLIPKLKSAIEYFEKVDDQSDYTFTVTPKMLGDLDEDPLELDLTEIFLMETQLNLIWSVSNMIVAYSFEFGVYDSIAIINSLSQGSGFLALRTNGATAMSEAKTSLLAASSKLDEAIDFLKSETDDQSDDIIKISPDDLHASDLDSIVKYNADFMEYLINGWTLTEDWDDISDTPDEPLTFKFNSLFDNPFEDYKALLPPYTVRVERDTSYDHDHGEGSIFIDTDVTAEIEGNYRYFRSIMFSDGMLTEDVDTTTSVPEFSRIVDSLITRFEELHFNYYHITIDWSGFLIAGTSNIVSDVFFYYEIEVFDRLFFSAVVTFEAENFDEWIFPNPTLNGFLPDVTTDEEFKRIFGIVESDFEKEFYIEFDIELGLDKRGRNSDNSVPSKHISFLTPWLK